jgi:hypothetical protein
VKTSVLNWLLFLISYLIPVLTLFGIFINFSSPIVLCLSRKCSFHLVTDKIISQATHLEEENKLSTWTMMPPALVYNGLFSRNACFLARVCDLLLKYDTSRYPSLRVLGLRAKLKEEVIYQQSYVADFMNSLWNQNVSNLTQEVDYACFT